MHLRQLMIRLILLTLLPPAVLAVVLGLLQIQATQVDRDTQAAGLARQAGAALDAELMQRVGGLQALAASPLLDDRRRWKDAYALALAYRDTFGGDVILASPDRRMLFDTVRPYGSALPPMPRRTGRLAAEVALRTGRPAVGDAFIGPGVHRQLISVAVPVRRAGRTTATLLAIYDMPAIGGIVDSLTMPTGWALEVRDSSGALLGWQGPAALRDAQSARVVHAQSSPLSAWSVAVIVPRAAYEAPVWRVAVGVGAALALAALISLLGALLISRRVAGAVASLVEDPACGARESDIVEVAAVRRRLAVAAQQQRQALDEVARGAARFRRLFHEAPLALASVNSAGLIVDRNARFVEVLGYDAAALGSLDQWWVRAYPDPAYRAEVMAQWTARVDAAAARGGEVTPVQVRVTCGDGSVKSMLISAIAVQDETLTAFVDLSDHERAEQALRELSRQLRIFVRTAPLSIAMLDRDLRYLACSGRWLVEYGRGHADLVGLRHYDVHPDLPDNWREVHRRALAGETVHDDRDRWTQADGSPHWLRWVVLPWYDEAGTIGGIIISAEDITKPVLAEQEIVALNASLERRVAERTAELSAANAELDAFAYAVSHDLRAPLRALSGFSQALLEDLGPRLQGEEATYLQQIGIAAGRMGELIDAILALSRSTRSELLPERVDASALARRQLQELQQAFPERKVDWSVEPGLELHGDPRMLAALIGNLIENAWKYTGKTDAARIRVHGGIVDDHAEFCVDDNGAGFDMAQAQHLFKPFQRLHRQDEFPGMGIGLATAQRIARRHGGQIRAQGAPGQGASFCLVLPGA